MPVREQSYMTDCIIIGAGLSGLTMAVTCAYYNISCTIIDPLNFQNVLSKKIDLRTAAISYATQTLFERINVWDSNKLAVTSIRDIRVCRENSDAYIFYDPKEVDVNYFGHIVRNQCLVKSLFEYIQSSNWINLLEEVELISYEENSEWINAHLSNGQTIQAKLIIAADGRHSSCRKLANIKCFHKKYDQKALTGIIKHQNSHQNIALELFGPTGPFALLPMENHQMSFIYCDKPEKIDFYAKKENQSYLKETLEKKCGNYLGEIEFVGEYQSYPLSLLQADQLYKGRIALIGEAAHAMHPVAGQGFNVSARDIAALGELLHQQKSLGLDVGSSLILEEYSRWRRFDITQLVVITDKLIHFLCTGNFLINNLQDFSFNMVNHFSIIKHFFMKDAMGILGDLPELLKPIVKKEA